MGIVYSALDPKLERPVAIKTLREPPPDPVARERLTREARAAAAINHPRLPALRNRGGHRRALHGDGAAGGRVRSPRRIGRGPLSIVRSGFARARHARRDRCAARDRARAPGSEALERVPDRRTASSCSISAVAAATDADLTQAVNGRRG